MSVASVLRLRVEVEKVSGEAEHHEPSPCLGSRW